MTGEITTVLIEKVRLDGGTQPRASIDSAVVSDYAAEMTNGETFAPILVYFDGTHYWLADGFHRVHAAYSIGVTEISAEVLQGTQVDAQWASYGVNAKHGLRRTNEDKRRAVEAALRHPMAEQLTDVQIARHCGVDNKTVGNYRKTIIGISNDSTPVERLVTRNGTTYPMQTANIGKVVTPENNTEPTYTYVEPEPIYTPQQTTRISNETPYTTPSEKQSVSVVHEAAVSVEWYTPVRYIDAVRNTMGGIDLDPASNIYAQTRVKADTWYGLDHPNESNRNGLTIPWVGRVWINPPYGAVGGRAIAAEWAHRLIEQYDEGNVTQGIILINAVIDSKWFDPLWRFPMCLTNHRIQFDTPPNTTLGTPRSPVIGSAFVYMGNNLNKFVSEFSQFGAVVTRLEPKE